MYVSVVSGLQLKNFYSSNQDCFLVLSPSSFCHLVADADTILMMNVLILRCSFITESEQVCKQWIDSMQNAIHVALSNCDVAEQIWAEPSNSFCADCGIPKPEWAAINLCVVICNQCAGLFVSLYLANLSCNL